MIFKENLIRTVFLVILIPGLLLSSSKQSGADELKIIRIRAGLDLFTSILAADKEISLKKETDNTLKLLLVYRNDSRLAKSMATYLMSRKSVRGTRISVDTCSVEKITACKNQPLAGVFLVQQMKQDLESIIQLGQDKQVIVFSPFTGDVEKGVSTGFIISDIIKPYLNMQALEDASINLKPFFLKVAELYEQ